MKISNSKNYSVLVVDDEVNVCEFLKDFLTYEGYCVSVSTSSKQALDMVQKQHFDLILLDIIMPEINGLEFMARVKRAIPHVNVMVITGSKDQNIRDEAYRLGAVDYIDKPIDLDYLAHRISSFFSDQVA